VKTDYEIKTDDSFLTSNKNSSDSLADYDIDKSVEYVVVVDRFCFLVKNIAIDSF